MQMQILKTLENMGQFSGVGALCFDFRHKNDFVIAQVRFFEDNLFSL